MKAKMKNKKQTDKKNKIELMAPAGDFRTLTAAVKSGADAVYFGLKQFNMRASGKNFSVNELDKIKEICNKKDENGIKRNVKMYLTLNTIIYDNELEKLKNLIKKVKNKIDAIICWDLSVIKLCKKYKIPFFISTQASVSNSEAAKFYKNLGASRVILARELSLKQIKQINKKVKIDTEVFIHGAMCVSVSGRCFTSQFLHNRSANRGLCMHPCRHSYIVKDEEGNELKVKNNKIFSAKDLCSLPFIEKLKKSNAKSFKIEGRNREPEYVYTAVRTYRKAIDNKLTKKEMNKLLKELNKVYNKGFSSGFYFGLPTNDDFSKKQHSSSTHKKKFIGKVFRYWKKPEVAGIKLNTGKLKIGDDIYLIGKNTFEKTKISSMEINNKKVKSVKKGQEVGIKLPYCRRNDKIYLIEKRKNV